MGKNLIKAIPNHSKDIINGVPSFLGEVFKLKIHPLTSNQKSTTQIKSWAEASVGKSSTHTTNQEQYRFPDEDKKEDKQNAGT